MGGSPSAPPPFEPPPPPPMQKVDPGMTSGPTPEEMARRRAGRMTRGKMQIPKHGEGVGSNTFS